MALFLVSSNGSDILLHYIFRIELLFPYRSVVLICIAVVLLVLVFIGYGMQSN